MDQPDNTLPNSSFAQGFTINNTTIYPRLDLNPGANPCAFQALRVSSNTNPDDIIINPRRALQSGAQQYASCLEREFENLAKLEVDAFYRRSSVIISDLDTKFRRFTNTIQETQNGVYIHDRLLFFYSQKAKRRSCYANEQHRTYSHFWRAKKNGACVRMALCPMPSGLYTWAAALIKSENSRGAYLLIYQSDWVPWHKDVRKKEMLPLSCQRAFWKQAKQNGAIALWYHAFQPKLRCKSVEKAMQWLQRMVDFGDKPLTKNDERLNGFRPLSWVEGKVDTRKDWCKERVNRRAGMTGD